MKYKLIVSDVDGVWTDGSFYYSPEGDSLRKFTTKDSYGVRLCQLIKLPLLILSTEENPMVQLRMEKLEVSYVKLGVKNKLRSLLQFCERKKIDISEVAYIGDDMNDYPLIGKVGFFGCPKDAYSQIRKRADLVLQQKGGEGAFREFVETLLDREGMLELSYDKYITSCQGKQE